MSEKAARIKRKTTNPLANAMLSDMYQLTMTYAHWKIGREKEHSTFNLFFRKHPFGGEYTIFAGLAEVIAFMDSFHFTPEQIKYLKKQMPDCEDEFFDYLAKLDCSEMIVMAPAEGSAVFPREPLMQVSGPLGICQIVETTLLNLTNFATLMATNATRFRMAAGTKMVLAEFGLRRAQGPDGAMTASRSAYIGGFDSTSNLLAGMIFGIPVKGTHAHAFVQSFKNFGQIKRPMLKKTDGTMVNFVEEVKAMQQKLGKENVAFLHTNVGELASFTAYALAFPKGFLALVDTYDTLNSGVLNFIIVARALIECGYSPVGIRLDSGDLAYLSKESRKLIDTWLQPYIKAHQNIVASNDIDEKIILALQAEGHEIDTLGIGTWLVTCRVEPAMGGVYKLVEIDHDPVIKLSQDAIKTTIPGAKMVYRLIGKDGIAINDVIVFNDEVAPVVGKELFCRDPFNSNKRMLVTPSHVIPLLEIVWNGEPVFGEESLDVIRDRVKKNMSMLRSDITRPVNPTPYKISVSQAVYDKLHDMMESEAPIPYID